MGALLERFYEVDDGRVLIDGHDVRTLDPTWMRQKAIAFIRCVTNSCFDFSFVTPVGVVSPQDQQIPFFSMSRSCWALYETTVTLFVSRQGTMKCYAAICSQEPVLFGCSILENIRYAKQEATDEQVRG